MTDKSQDKQYPPEEAQRRFEATLRGALATPPEPRGPATRKGEGRKRRGEKVATTGMPPVDLNRPLAIDLLESPPPWKPHSA